MYQVLRRTSFMNNVDKVREKENVRIILRNVRATIFVVEGQ
jgi:hypothetical protein